jgi:alpha-galactosidase
MGHSMLRLRRGFLLAAIAAVWPALVFAAPAPPGPASAPAAAPQQGVPDYIRRLLGQPAAGGIPKEGEETAAAPSAAETQPPAAAPAPVLRGSSAERAPERPAAAASAAPEPPALTGRWTAKQIHPGSAPLDAVLTFDGDGGTMQAGANRWSLFEVRQTGEDIAFTVVIPGTPYTTIHYRGTVTGDAITAMAETGYAIEARREDAAAPDGPTVASAAPPPTPPEPAAAPATAAAPSAEPAPAAAEPEPTVISPIEPPAPPAPALPAPAPTPQMSPDALIPALREPEPMPQIASIAPPPEAAAPPPARPRYTPPPVSTAAIAKLPLPPLRDVPAGASLKLPPMGWATRQKLGTMIDDQAIRQAAEGLEETGLKAAGYTTIEIDDGWQGQRDANGVLHANPEFPDMKALGDFLHSKGLSFALSTSVAPQSCAGYTGSYGHEAEDAKTFASWGVDILIYDWCGAEKIYATQPEMQAATQKMGEALRASGRDIGFEIANGGAFNVASWGGRTGANLWRTGKDIEDRWASAMEAGFAVAGAPAGNGQPHWNDPGLLQTGNGGMALNEYRAQFNLWAVLGAPLLLGNDVRIMRRETVDLLTNKEVLAIDQDPLARQGIRIASNANTGVWAKPLSNGAVAVLFVNRGDSSAPASVTWEQLGIEGQRRVRDVWWHENIGMANNRYGVFLTAHTSVLVVLSREP